MDSFIEESPIEYYGVNSSSYHNPVIIENIIFLPENVKPKSILKVYSNLDLIFNTKSKLFKNAYSCICNINFNIEYIDYGNDDTISIFHDYIYCPLHFSIDSDFSFDDLTPKLSNVHLKLLDISSVYIYLTITPY